MAVERVLTMLCDEGGLTRVGRVGFPQPQCRVPHDYAVYSGGGHHRRKLWPPEKSSPRPASPSHVMYLAKMLHAMSASDELIALDTAMHEVVRQLHGCNAAQAQLLDKMRRRYLTLVRGFAAERRHARHQLCSVAAKAVTEGVNAPYEAESVKKPLSFNIDPLPEAASGTDCGEQQTAVAELRTADVKAFVNGSFAPEEQKTIAFADAKNTEPGEIIQKQEKQESEGKPKAEEYLECERATECDSDEEGTPVNEAALPYAMAARRRLKLARTEHRAAAQAEEQHQDRFAAIKARAEQVATAHMRAVAAAAPPANIFEHEHERVEELRRLMRSTQRERLPEAWLSKDEQLLLPGQPRIGELASEAATSFVIAVDDLVVAVRITLQAVR